MLADYVTDIGDGGLFLRTEAPFEIGQTVSVTLSFPGLLEPTIVPCIVRWIARGDAADGTRRQTGVGMEFLSTSNAEPLRPLLERLTRQHEEALRAKQELKVMLVDDNNFVSELFRHAVARFERLAQPRVSVGVVSATTAVEALRLIDNGETPDLMVVDHYMPGLSGVELVRRVREDPRFARTPILMVSVGGQEVKEAALAAGATLFVDKPVLLTQLIETMRVLLARQEA